MLARVELARAAVWDAAARRRRPRPTRAPRSPIAAAAALAFDAAFANAQGLRADARRHRLHVGARRAHLPAPRDDAAPAHRNARRLARARRRRPRCAARAGASPSTCPAKATARHEHRAFRAELRAFLAEIRPAAADRATQPARGRGLRHARVARAVGPRRQGARAARHRRGVPRREGGEAEHRRRRVGAAEPHRARHRGAARTVDHADAARRDRLVPALQRARRGLRPRVARRRARRASKAAGS